MAETTIENAVSLCFPHPLLLLDTEGGFTFCSHWCGSSSVDSDCQDFRETPMSGRGRTNLAGMEDLSVIS